MGIHAVAHALQAKAKTEENRSPSKDRTPSKQAKNQVSPAGEKSSPIKEKTPCKQAENEAPPAGLHTYGWAEERLSKSAAIAAANWDHPEAYMDYVRRTTASRKKQKHRSAPPPERKRVVMPVARPPDFRREVALPLEPPPSLEQALETQRVLDQELPPSLEKPDLVETQQTMDRQHSQESTADDSLSPPVRTLVTDHLVSSGRAVALTACEPGSECGSPGKAKKPPRSAWDDQPGEPVAHVEKPPGKCHCVSM